MRGTEKGLVILDRDAFVRTQRQQHYDEPRIVKVISYGNGWINVRMSDGYAYRRSGGTLSWRYNNPGNIKYGRFARSNGAIGRGWGSHGGHAVFPTMQAGREAKRILLFTPIRKYYNLTLRDALSYYAPRSDGNRPDVYARYVAKRTPGISIYTRLRDMDRNQQEHVLNAMQQFEGYRPGKIVRI